MGNKEQLQVLKVSVPFLSKKERLDSFLAEQCTSLSRTRLKNLIKDGHVSLKGEVILDPSYSLKEGDSFDITIPPLQDPTPQPQALDLDIVYEDKDLIVINKPAGLTVHPAPGSPDSTLVNALLAYCGSCLSGIGGVRRPGIVHRLDKETSGLMVVAKSDAAHQGLMAQFKEKTLSRKYKAFVLGSLVPLHGSIEKNIDRSFKDRKKMTVTRHQGKPAKTDYKTLKVFKSETSSKAMASLIECKLHTGRTHQIRVHCASLHHPLLGDDTYGHTSLTSPLGKILTSLKWKKNRQALHAYALQFCHPISGETLSFETPLPEDMAALLKALEAM